MLEGGVHVRLALSALALVRTIFAQADAASTRHQFAVALAELEPRFLEAAALLAEAREELLAFTHFDRDHWRQI